MNGSATAITSADAGVERYREAERILWNHYGLQPTERFVDVSSPAARLRIVEVGAGPPLLLVPGTAGTGPYWGALVRELKGFRCLVLDRPGWGLSTPLDYSSVAYGTAVADLLRGVLDALEIDWADVVGASIGDVWALRLASRHPARVGRVVLLGGGPIVAESGAPGVIRLETSGIEARAVARVHTPSRTPSRASAGAGLAFDRETDSMRNERDMVRAIVSWRKGLRPELTFDDAELAAIQQPTLLVYGTADPVGTVEIWRRVVDLLPRGELQLVDGAGHMPWLDDPRGVADHVSRFLAT